MSADNLDGQAKTPREEVCLANIRCEKMTRKFCRTFEPLKLIAPLQQPAGNVGGSLLVMNLTDEGGLRGPKDFFAALQYGRFGTFDIDLDQAGQRVLPRNSVQSGGFDFDCGPFLGRAFHKHATIHAGLETRSLKTQTAIGGRYRLRNNPYRVKLIARSVFFDASNVRGIGFKSKYRTVNTQIPRRNQTKNTNVCTDIVEDSPWPEVQQQNPIDGALIIALKIFHFIAGIEMNPETLAWARTNRFPHKSVRGNSGTREIPESGTKDGNAIRKSIDFTQWR